MPYIKDENKGKFEKCLKVFRDLDVIDNAGELNYFITNILLSYIKHRGLKYETLNGVHGVLSCINSEIQNRITAPYERKKIRENGDLELFEELIRDIAEPTEKEERFWQGLKSMSLKYKDRVCFRKDKV